jgi:hypothetical protein
MVFEPTPKETRALLMDGCDEIMRAYLPPAREMKSNQAVITLVEGLSQWLDSRIHIVVSAASHHDTFYLGLTDIFGVGTDRLYYEVTVLEKAARRPRGKRIRGLGDFSDLHRLRLRAIAGAL